MFCAKCGNQLPNNARFCNKCGEPAAAQPSQSYQSKQAIHQQYQSAPASSQSINASSTTTNVRPVNVPPQPNGDFFSIGEYIIDERISAFKFTNAYKIFNTTGQQIGMVEQQKVSGGAKAARILLGSNVKALQKFKLDIKDINGIVLTSIQRGGAGSSGGLRNVSLFDGTGNIIGTIKFLFSLLKPKLEIIAPNGQLIGRIQGDWKGWNFSITDINGNTIGTINKKWAGVMKEVFTTADKYYVKISPNAVGIYRQAIIAAAITIDMVLKEFK